MKSKITSIHALIQNFFLHRMMQQRKVSTETIHSYRDAFRIYIEYLQEIYGIKPSSMEICQYSLEYLEGFCRYLEEKRSNKPATINNRVAAIKSFLHYVAEMEPEYSEIVQRALMLPAQKQEYPTIDFLTKNEFNSMLATCDTSSYIGARDKLMLMLLYNTGVRVSELLAISTSSILKSDSINNASLRINGKGRKQREVPLWKSTVRYINRYVNDFPIVLQRKLFVNKNGTQLTRSGVRARINIIVTKASEQSPSLLEKNVTPHTFRHSVAMNLLQSGIDISTIAIWLGHSSIETTHKYMIANMEIKRKAMEKAGILDEGEYSYTPSDGLISFLKTL